MSERHRDPGLWLQYFWQWPILVRCPACQRAAACVPEPGQSRPAYYRDTRWRLVCGACGYARDAGKPTVVRLGGAVDPFFGEPLLLQVDCVGHVLWAYNEAHLEELRRYVDASQRERASFADEQYQTMLEKLPTWIKLAKNRSAVTRALDRMQLLISDAP